jgi:hypothetical protein
MTEVIRLERVRLNVNSDPTKYATAHLSMFRWRGVRGGGFNFVYQRFFCGCWAEIGVKGRGGSSESESESESYPIVEASSDPRPSSTTTRRNKGAPVVGDSERVAISAAWWKGDGAALSLTDSLRASLVHICPSFSILCSKTVHSRLEDPGRLREAKSAVGFVRGVLFPLGRDDTGEEPTRFPTLGRVGRDCSSVCG